MASAFRIVPRYKETEGIPLHSFFCVALWPFSNSFFSLVSWVSLFESFVFRLFNLFVWFVDFDTWLWFLIMVYGFWFFWFRLLTLYFCLWLLSLVLVTFLCLVLHHTFSDCFWFWLFDFIFLRLVLTLFPVFWILTHFLWLFYLWFRHWYSAFSFYLPFVHIAFWLWFHGLFASQWFFHITFEFGSFILVFECGLWHYIFNNGLKHVFGLSFIMFIHWNPVSRLQSSVELRFQSVLCLYMRTSFCVGLFTTAMSMETLWHNAQLDFFHLADAENLSDRREKMYTSLPTGIYSMKSYWSESHLFIYPMVIQTEDLSPLGFINFCSSCQSSGLPVK